MRDEQLLEAGGETLRRLRTEQDLSQEALGLRTGVHRNYIGGIERAERRPTVDVVDRLTTGLGVSLTDFYAQVEQALGR